MGSVCSSGQKNVVEPQETPKNDKKSTLEENEASKNVEVSKGSEKPEENEAILKKHKAALIIQKNYRGMKSREVFNRVITCYCCGEKLGILEIQDHIPDCTKQQRLQWKIIPSIIRPPKPLPPTKEIPNLKSSQKDIKEYNDQAFKIFKEKIGFGGGIQFQKGIHCINCKNTFQTPDEYAYHLQTECKLKNGENWNLENYCSQYIQNIVKIERIQHSLFCYQCGKAIPHQHLEDHINDCSKEIDEIIKQLPDNLKPKELPKKPETKIPNTEEKKKILDYIRECRSNYKQFINSIPKCEHCSLAFTNLLDVKNHECSKE